MRVKFSTPTPNPGIDKAKEAINKMKDEKDDKKEDDKKEDEKKDDKKEDDKKEDDKKDDHHKPSAMSTFQKFIPAEAGRAQELLTREQRRARQWQRFFHKENADEKKEGDIILATKWPLRNVSGVFLLEF